MPETSRIVINTGPTIALVGAIGSLAILENLYEEVIVPYEVTEELLADNGTRFGAREFRQAGRLTKLAEPSQLSPYLANSLDRGEAAVIQVALNRNIETVCIDEPAGRRVARLSGVSVTGQTYG